MRLRASGPSVTGRRSIFAVSTVGGHFLPKKQPSVARSRAPREPHRHCDRQVLLPNVSWRRFRQAGRLPEMRNAVGAESRLTAPEKVVYTCPMHPEVRQDKPGTCPKCGMDLEPEHAEASEEEDDPELRAMTRRFWVSVVLGAARPSAGDAADAGRAARSSGSDIGISLDSVRVEHAGGALGWLAVLPARLAVAGHLESQYVHADRDRNRRSLFLQRRRHLCFPA